MPDIRKAVTAAWEAAWDRGEIDALDAIIDPGYIRESAGSGTTSGLAELKLDILDVRGAFPDLHTTVDKLIVDDDDFAVFWTSTGTFTNALAAVPATGRRVQTRGSNQGTLRNGLVTYERVTWDQSELLADLGVPSLRSAFEGDVPEPVIDDLSGALSADALKGFNRQFFTGVTVVTTVDAEGVPRGLAANSYASISLEPPLVLICVQKTSSTYPALFQATHLGINILSNQQRSTVATFASKTPDKFASLQWHGGAHGSPLIDGSSAAIEAEIKERFQAKTHTVFIAKVTQSELSDAVPMIYKSGHFFDGASLDEL
ncbi:flavin reductase [Mycetocola sp.]|uniref:flavin reductase n=1 Tax=Mycetocola sp. TaxID=1871042 RepID=UPI003989B7B2